MHPCAKPDRRPVIAIGLIATIIALLSARPYAGGWNDGSRLATVECLVDRGTLSIDRSIFVEVPALAPGRPSPYPRDDELLQRFGTKDKLFVDGRYYSDKSPVPALYLAGVYQIARALGMPSAAERPDLFCLLMTWLSSGIAFVVAWVCVYAIGCQCRISSRQAGFLSLFFALGTTALPYAQQVNNHILLLGVAAGLFLQLLLGDEKGWTPRRLLVAGTLAGSAYTIDLGAGPPLTILALGYLAWRTWNLRGIVALLAALPWIGVHHILNYAIGGTIGPANAVPEYFDWPGSPFSSRNMTGGWAHKSPAKALVYAFDMLFGKKGFLGHDLPLFLVLISLPLLLRAKYAERGVVRLGLIWGVSTWLLYATTSTNLSGACCSIRWLVPLLTPGFLGIAIVVREAPYRRVDWIVLGCGGLLLGVGMGIRGPWFQRLMPFYWVIYLGTIMAWMMVCVTKRLRAVPSSGDSVVLSTRIGFPARQIAKPGGVASNPAPVAAKKG